MNLRKIQDIDVKDKKILLRVDFNVAVEKGKVKENFKIAAVKESLDYLLNRNCKIALLSHFGRPNGKVDMEFSLAQIRNDVEEILGVKIKFVDDCIGEKVKNGLDNLIAGEILLLENVRFYSGDESNDEKFTEQLTENFDIFINDAFSVCHRDQASVTGMAKFLPSCAGFRLLEEIHEMTIIKDHPISPAIAIIGGAKIETKLPVIKFFEKKYDYILVGGKIANEALDQKIKFSKKVILPFDFVDDQLDIGPKTLEKFKEIISGAKTIVWNGPTGKFEDEKYAVSSNEILKAILVSGAYTVVGGGETLEILEKNYAMEKIDFVSTGGGAMLDYLAGNKMPGIEVLRSN
ncbi:MAG TPA: hypothetical protein DCS28_04070 [Candidatus Moranbacteria bacterium]|nr:hypothetical protein [Candidatus Moranbacteria bacterium]